MIEKNNVEGNQIKKERFEFVFSINGNTICQRYFRINNLIDKALGSTRLTEAIESCVEMINDDLKTKTEIYLRYTAPQVFKNKEEMEEWVKNRPFKLEHPCHVVLDDSDDSYVWNGVEMLPYAKQFFKSDYAKPVNNTNPAVLKFAFLDNGREVRSISWDGNVYPKFVRGNIDISNSRNKYADPDNYAPIEEFITGKYVKWLPDLIPQIVREICVACSDENEKYVNSINYGDRTYNIDANSLRRKYIRDYENWCKKKTIAYFSQNN